MRRVLVLAVAMAVMLALAAPASAGKGNGAIQLSATGFPDDFTECTDFDDTEKDFPIDIRPEVDGVPVDGWSLDGCLYQVFGPGHGPQPSGTYQETGEEEFVGDLLYDGDVVASGTFMTTYRFTAKFQDGDFLKEIFGRCQHPLVAGEGSEDFAGASGRLDFKDVITDRAADGTVLAVEFPMRGHLRNVILNG